MTISDENRGRDEPDDDLGEPIRQLGLLAVPPAPGFVERVRSRIERRRLGSHVVGLAWYGPILIFLELLAMLFEALGPRAEGKENKPWKK